jgi:hypothetical protein
MTAVDYEYPNTYGSQELAHILGQDWLQDGGGTDDDDAAAQLRTAPTPAYHTNESGEVESVTHNIVETVHSLNVHWIIYCPFDIDVCKLS